MNGLVTRSGALAPYLSSTVEAIPSYLARGAVPFVSKLTPERPYVPERPVAPLTPTSRRNKMLSRALRVTSSIAAPMQVRCSHSSIGQVPSFDDVRKPEKLSTASNAGKTDVSEDKVFGYLVAGVAGAGACYSAKSLVKGFVSYWGMSADVLALAQIEVNLAEIPEGKNVVVKWRGKPVFVRHRTPEEVDEVRAVDVASLRHPETDEERVKEDEWLVAVGICTHLGCVPIANAGDFGGYYCPCHGSHYDASGRIRQGPAPLNLEIPEHSIDSDTLTIG